MPSENGSVSVLMARDDLVQAIQETREQLPHFKGDHVDHAQVLLHEAEQLLDLVPASLAAECDRRAAGHPRPSMAGRQAELGGR